MVEDKGRNHRCQAYLMIIGGVIVFFILEALTVTEHLFTS